MIRRCSSSPLVLVLLQRRRRSSVFHFVNRLFSHASPVQEPHLIRIYKAMVSDSRIEYDDKQFGLVKRLARLSDLLPEDFEPVKTTIDEQLQPQSSGNGEGSASPPLSAAQLALRLRGLYIHGDVGSGKTFLMDLFFDHCALQKKKRVHFHKFMLDVHKRIHDRKKQLREMYGLDVNINLSSERDAIAYVAADVSKEAYLLCFDEFQVTDICDALMLSKFFDVLWNNGTVLVATSNRPPIDLYKDGLNRKYFVPFIHRLQKECIVREMANSRDYRQLTVRAANTFYTPCNDATRDQLLALFRSSAYLPISKVLAEGSYQSAAPAHTASSFKVVTDEFLYDMAVPIMMGRTIRVPMARTITLAHEEGVQVFRAAWVEFSDLCDTDRGASDYSSLCRHFDALFLHGVPTLSVAEHDRARRFITLVDEVYDRRRALYWTADSDPNDMFSAYEPLDNNNNSAESSSKDIRNISTIFKNSSSTSCVYNSVTEIHSVVNTNTVSNTVSPLYTGEALSYTNDSQEVTILVGELASVQELRFAFKRAASRLTELSGGRATAAAALD